MTQIDFPALDAPVSAAFPSTETLQLLTHRRSASAALLQAPGPQGDELQALLLTASRVPDHRKMAPFRFLTFDDEAREEFVRVLTSAAPHNEEAKELSVDAIRMQVMRAPTLVALISSVNPEHRTPVWEQELTAGAVGFNILLTASAMGYAGQWLTEWMAFDANVAKGLGLTENERVAGFFYLGTLSDPVKERPRPSADIIRAWTGPSA